MSQSFDTPVSNTWKNRRYPFLAVKFWVVRVGRVSFSLSDSVVLKDGQTSEFVAATDKLTGEVTKIDVTLIVVK